jgi:hypothetical protein
MLAIQSVFGLVVLPGVPGSVECCLDMVNAPETWLLGVVAGVQGSRRELKGST